MASTPTDSSAVERGGAPPFCFLLPPPAPSDVSATDNTSKTVDQWLWYFYLTAWSRPFFYHRALLRPTIVSDDNYNVGVEKGGAGNFGLSLEESLALVGFPAADVVEAYEARWRSFSKTSGGADVQAESLKRMGGNCMYPPLPHVAESCFGRAFRALAVHDHLSAPAPSSSSVTPPSRSLEKLVQQALDVTRQRCCPPPPGDESGMAMTEEKAIQSALQVMISLDVTMTQCPLLFTLESVTSTDDSGRSKKWKKVEEEEEGEFISEAHRARLFAALTVEAFSRVKKACACMLLAYVNSRCGKVAKARACGIVVGIVEYAVAYRCYREDGTGRCPLSAAALLLCSLVELQEAVKREKVQKYGKEEAEEEVLSGGLFATITVACLQELFFAAVVGGVVTPHRLPPVVAKDAPRSIGKVVVGRNKPQQHPQKEEDPSFQMTVRPAVSRALTLHEVDALLQVLLPVLLQQVGFEWPWSECLRWARVLDKLQQKDVTRADGVRLNSRAAFDELLAAVGRRTYVSRFQNILPQSYESLFAAVGKAAANNDTAAHDEDGEGTGEASVRQPLFVIPTYYQAAGERMIEFFESSGLGGTTAQETERVLIRNTDVQPMIVQLQALGSRMEGVDDSDGHNSLADDSDLLSTARLSEEEKHRLVLRYRCEVLLASLVVYTQLQTVSLVQQLLRQLAPLFEKLALPLMQERTLRHPFVLQRRQSYLNDGSNSTEGTIDFTQEFKVLMDDIRYEFYPLEWIPEAINAQLQWQTSETDASHSAFYSAFAAVAYQFGLVLHGGPQGLRGGDDTDYKVRMEAYRFFHVLLLNTLVDAVASSCELEGAMALAATRRVGGVQRNTDNNNNTNNNCNDESVQAQQLQQCGAASFHAVVNPHDVVLALAQCLLPLELVSRPQPVTVADVEGQRPSAEWLRRVIAWAQSARTRWVMQLQKVGGSTAPLASLPNSLTFDAVPLAREVVRGVRRRLIEKLHVKQIPSMAGHCNSSDPLLQQHLLSLQALLEGLALLPQHPSEDSAAVLSAAQLLWSSPLFSHELRLTGRLHRERINIPPQSGDGLLGY
ncbi:hypothetical protein TraAM80_07676 [Trypanosoma rangeli]|uniref:Nuclear cap binding complex subunit CBP110 n=1 Tax=Trypanosoma rangeli TaxID=5698 RepID=A0A422N4G1_TRYRA|nr:uncharacterized protein TraAM80_07676 [Trypanosoma rangeli]RNF00321.1 hypothetical protein TraAM80_07676 [Trypanosoma rangeli]|eukprot:RNF00321.1 hypothetical protein TraAM80_07676 [Trypanosoma rangeli]